MEGRGAPAVLRVRRKRCEDPAEVLMLPRKRQRQRSEEGVTAARLPPAPNIFKLAATLCSPQEPLPKEVREAWKRPEATRALNPSLQSQQRIRQDLLARKQLSRQEERYRLLSKHRAPWPEEEAPLMAEDSAHSTEGDQLDSEDSKPQAPGEDRAAVAGSPSAQEVPFLDIVGEAASEKEKPSTPASCPEKSDLDQMLCNAVKMIREQLSISKHGKGREHREREDDYVYDIYYLDTATPGSSESILPVQPYSHDWQLVANDQQACQLQEAQEEQDEDEDENSENHWLNDYPEEEEGSTDGDTTGASDEEDASLSDEENWAITPRTWNKYPQDVLKEFDYDGSLDFDSEEEHLFPQDEP